MVYAEGAKNRGYKYIIKYGVAFKNKLCGAVCETETNELSNS